MKNAKTKTKAQLVQELAELRRQTAGLEASERARKQAEAALRESEEKYRLLFEESRDAIVIAEMDGRITGVNQAFADLFGYTREEIVGGMYTRDFYVIETCVNC